MAYELSFGSVAVTKLCGVCYHLQCRLQEEKKQNRTQEKRKGSDITPPPFLGRPVMEALAFSIGRLRLRLATGALVYKIVMQRPSNQYHERDIIADISTFRFS